MWPAGVTICAVASPAVRWEQRVSCLPRRCFHLVHPDSLPWGLTNPQRALHRASPLHMQQRVRWGCFQKHSQMTLFLSLIHHLTFSPDAREHSDLPETLRSSRNIIQIAMNWIPFCVGWPATVLLKSVVTLLSVCLLIHGPSLLFIS